MINKHRQTNICNKKTHNTKQSRQFKTGNNKNNKQIHPNKQYRKQNKTGTSCETKKFKTWPQANRRTQHKTNTDSKTRNGK